MSWDFDDEENSLRHLFGDYYINNSFFDYLPSNIIYDYNNLEDRIKKIIDTKIKLMDDFWEEFDFKIIHKKKTSKKRVLFVDDDQFLIRDYANALIDSTIEVSIVFTPDDAIRLISIVGDIFDIIVFDIRMANGNFFGDFETCLGLRTGLFLAQEVSEIADSAIFIALSNSNDSMDAAWFENRENSYFIHKNHTTPLEFANFIKQLVMKEIYKPKSFIIHGHDFKSVLELKNFLQNKLNFEEPIILSEVSSKGMTVIEKFEHYSKNVDFVFAIFTPDDEVANNKNFARQNVLFEFGYFIGKYGRLKGNIFFLYKEGTYIPSDLSGLIYIDVTNGIEAAGEKIRNEINYL